MLLFTIFIYRPSGSSEDYIEVAIGLFGSARNFADVDDLLRIKDSVDNQEESVYYKPKRAKASSASTALPAL